jgi:hypothetical protein
VGIEKSRRTLSYGRGRQHTILLLHAEAALDLCSDALSRHFCLDFLVSPAKESEVLL